MLSLLWGMLCQLSGYLGVAWFFGVGRWRHPLRLAIAVVPGVTTGESLLACRLDGASGETVRSDPSRRAVPGAIGRDRIFPLNGDEAGNSDTSTSQ